MSGQTDQCLHGHPHYSSDRLIRRSIARRRKAFGTSAVGFIVGVLFMACATSFSTLMVGRIFVGLGVSTPRDRGLMSFKRIKGSESVPVVGLDLLQVATDCLLIKLCLPCDSITCIGGNPHKIL